MCIPIGIHPIPPQCEDNTTSPLHFDLDGFLSSDCHTNQSYPWYVPEVGTNNQLHPVHYNTTTLQEMSSSHIMFPNVLWLVSPEWEMLVKTLSVLPIVICGVLGNAVIIDLIIRNRHLRTPTNFLIVNMALADMALLLVCPALFLVGDFFQNYQLGALGCKGEGLLDGGLLVTDVLNLIAISYDRLTAIVLPRETRLTLKGVKIIIPCTWLGGFIMALPLVIYRNYKERQWLDVLEKYCTENVTILPVYWHVLIAVMVWFPLTIIVICYSAIFWKLDRYEAEVLRRENPVSVSYRRKVAKMVFIVVVTFIVLRMPLTVIVFWRSNMIKKTQINQVNGAFTILWFIAHYLLFLNAAVNPLIYGLTNENFRRAFKTTNLYQYMRCNSSKRNTTKQVCVKTKPPRRPCPPVLKEQCVSSGFWFKRNLLSADTNTENSKKSNLIVQKSTKTTQFFLPADYI